jgi:hypothetical protein
LVGFRRENCLFLEPLIFTFASQQGCQLSCVEH